MLATPHQLMIAVRAAGIAAGLAALIELGGPFHYADLGLPFPDTVAHGLLFYGLAVLMLGALPRSRTSDIGWTLVGLVPVHSDYGGLGGEQDGQGLRIDAQLDAARDAGLPVDQA